MHSHILITPNMINADKDLLSLPHEKRGCVFEEEYPLEYFKMYSQYTCYLECYIKNLLNYCGCVPFESYRFLGLRNYLYCSESHIECIYQVRDRIVKLSMKSKLKEGACYCLPACSTLTFDYQSSSNQVVMPHSVPQWADGYNSSLESNIARLSLYFGVQQFSALTRRLTSSFSDFLGNCGGLLGLLLGFSFMSLFEVFYFAFIRPARKTICILINKLDIVPDVVPLGVKVKPVKIKDVENLLAKHFGNEWKNRPDLNWYVKVLEKQQNCDQNPAVHEDTSLTQVGERQMSNRCIAHSSRRETDDPRSRLHFLKWNASE
ncbi:pickpocket protein 28-like [Homalodisca vitripennis]|uniref:pickpocket protein 28-like n=1 Tax=Homalodisca vitripennis TaxID=197043 RepID=UPI001EEAE9A4|nr:pickpocket protein 28-like [Homalodisca vitripennis]